MPEHTFVPAFLYFSLKIDDLISIEAISNCGLKSRLKNGSRQHVVCKKLRHTAFCCKIGPIRVINPVLLIKKEGKNMNLNAPTKIVFLISLLLAVLAILGMFVAIPVVSGNAALVAIIAYAVLAAGNLLKGM